MTRTWQSFWPTDSKGWETLYQWLNGFLQQHMQLSVDFYGRKLNSGYKPSTEECLGSNLRLLWCGGLLLMGWKVVIILYGWLGWCGEVRMWELRARLGSSTWLYNMRLAAPHQGLGGGSGNAVRAPSHHLKLNGAERHYTQTPSSRRQRPWAAVAPGKAAPNNKTPAHLEVPTRDGDPLSDLGTTLSSWYGTYSDDCTKQITTAPIFPGLPSPSTPVSGKIMSSGTDQDGLPKAARHLSASLPWPLIQDDDSATVILFGYDAIGVVSPATSWLTRNIRRI